MKIQTLTQKAKTTLYRPFGWLLLAGLLLALTLTPAHAQGGNSITTPDTGFISTVTALVLDSNGYPVVSYYDGANGDLKVMHCNDPNCAGDDESIAILVSFDPAFPDSVQEISLVLDSNGYPVIGYFNFEQNYIGLKLIHCNDPNCAGGDESISTPETSLPHYFGELPSLALDSNGYPVISSTGSGYLNVLHCNDPNCAGGDESVTFLSFNVNPDVSEYPSTTSLVLDSNDYPVISFAISIGLEYHALGVLRCNDPNCAGDDESVTFSEITNVGNAGEYNSLALDGNGYPVISYLARGTNGVFNDRDLKVMHCNDPNCAGDDESISAPDTEGNVGEWSSLALDSNGYPIISYFDDTNDDLKVMHCNDPNCTGGDEIITAPDTAGRVGKRGSLALDSNGYPVVSYYDQDNQGLKVLHCGSPDCIIPTDTTPPVITPNISGTLGDNGWYTSDVEVSWTVTDDESTISSTGGCETTTINSDTAGTTLTCEATSDGGSNSASVTIQRDATPPTANAGVSSAPNGNGWYNSDVTVSFSGSDDLSGLAGCDSDILLGSDGAGQSAGGVCTDLAGNASAPATADGINIDKTAPVVSVTGVEEGAQYILGAVPTAGCDTQDATAGVATQASLTVSGGNSNGVGSFIATCDGAVDNAGNPASAGVTYSVIYDFGNFTEPIDPGAVNQVKGGQTVPVKFSLNGDQGMAILAEGYPASQEVACDGSAPVNEVEETDTPGNSSLSYDPATDQYSYKWKTEKSWKGTCRQLIVQFDDGSAYTALFQFK